MRVWIVMIGESLPIDGNIRSRRVATLCNHCAARGHDVTWWTSTFDHTRKRQRASADKSVTTNGGVKIEMLYAPGYKANISVGRLVNHHLIGAALARRIYSEAPPDVILAAWPTIELSAASVKYGRMMRIPVIVDVRDLWPDIFLDVAPRWLRPGMQVVLRQLGRKAKYVFSNCDGIVGISPGYLRWALDYAGRAQQPSDRVFPLGYERPRSDPYEVAQARRELLNLGVNPGRTICWFVGVFGATYDLSTVIKAASILQASREDTFQFVLSGGGEHESEWKRQAVGLDNVTFTGWVDAAKICALGEMARVGLAAYARSAPQGLPNKLFEYMAFGLPVVSSLAGEAREFLNEHQCGVTYQAGSPESLLSALKNFQSDDALREAYGERGFNLYERFYSAEKIYPAMADYLEGIGSRVNRVARAAAM